MIDYESENESQDNKKKKMQAITLDSISSVSGSNDMSDIVDMSVANDNMNADN